MNGLGVGFLCGELDGCNDRCMVSGPYSYPIFGPLIIHRVSLCTFKFKNQIMFMVFKSIVLFFPLSSILPIGISLYPSVSEIRSKVSLEIKMSTLY